MDMGNILPRILPADIMTLAIQMALNPTAAMNKLMHDPSAVIKGLERNSFNQKMVCTPG